MLEQNHQKSDNLRCKNLVGSQVETEAGRWATSNIVLRKINDLSRIMDVDAHELLEALESLNKVVTEPSDVMPR